ncbi:hypothetical protein [Corynebacterium lowii]|uniref:DUF2178 domain-containing protein n=1 Tax=Corynebacterium lowii TaxID=1544413 RepID=A0A0Q0YEM2_9CORY|nr:hypothetical protein [Corynebacterium lowii]KQB84835.1 hypothetical protein Clow_02097 [Corynebacterium lowii]MDP9851739.1 O-antigen/teichoic acid export membrane protein [Corynebacterium lowii]
MSNSTTSRPNLPIPATVRNRQRAIQASYFFLAASLIAIPLLFFFKEFAQPLWYISMLGCVCFTIYLARATNNHAAAYPEELDEYEGKRVLHAKRYTMYISLFSLLGIAFALDLLAPYIVRLDLSPEAASTLVRAIGMLAGTLAFYSIFSVQRGIARGMNKDELAEQQDAYA